MSRASEIILLCEDKVHEISIKRFLKKGWSIKPRMIRVIPYPQGKGSGKGHVLKKIAAEVSAYRRRQASTAMIVVIDADEISAENIKDSLDGEIGGRAKDERIFYAIPRWHIQTWLAYFDGKEANTGDKKTYKHEYDGKSKGNTKLIHRLVDGFADECKNKQELQSPPKELEMACLDFERIRNALKK